jgi:hypothetical protein
MALPQLNHKNVVRYFGSWVEKVDEAEDRKIGHTLKKLKRDLRTKNSDTVQEENSQKSSG